MISNDNNIDIFETNVYYDHVLGLIRSDINKLPDEDEQTSSPGEESNDKNNVEDLDDLHEIKVDDDLNEPNPDPESKPKPGEDPDEPQASE